MPAKNRSKSQTRAEPKAKKLLMDVWEPVFNKIDTDRSGSIDTRELMTAMRKTFPKMNIGLNDVIGMMNDADINNSGDIDLEEFSIMMEKAKDEGSTSLWGKAEKNFFSAFGDDMTNVTNALTAPLRSASQASAVSINNKKIISPSMRIIGSWVTYFLGNLYFGLAVLYLCFGNFAELSRMAEYSRREDIISFLSTTLLQSIIILGVPSILLGLFQLVQMAQGRDVIAYFWGWQYQDKVSGRDWEFGMMFVYILLEWMWYGLWFWLATIASVALEKPALFFFPWHAVPYFGYLLFKGETMVQTILNCNVVPKK